MTLAYIGLGSNLDEPQRQLRSALARLASAPGLRLLRQSRLYQSTPLRPPGAALAAQPDYVNAVCAVEAEQEPQTLMRVLLEIEREAGRVRDGQRWGPRILDLDLLHYEGVELDSPSLRLPHPEIGRRNFVLVPLAEVAPDLEIPGLGLVRELARRIGQEGLRAL